MAGDTIITIIGNLTADPELRFTPSGAAVADFTIASTPRTFDRQTNEWKDSETLFMRCSVWRSYDTRDGDKRTVVELQVDEVGPSLRRARAQVTRTGGDGTTPNRSQQPAGRTNSPSQHADTSGQWNAPQGGSQNDPWRANSPAPF